MKNYICVIIFPIFLNNCILVERPVQLNVQGKPEHVGTIFFFSLNLPLKRTGYFSVSSGCALLRFHTLF